MSAIFSKVTLAKWSQEMLVPEGYTIKKFFSSLKPIENLVLIILGRFPISKSQK
jgi:hypothetical protein